MTANKRLIIPVASIVVSAAVGEALNLIAGSYDSKTLETWRPLTVSALGLVIVISIALVIWDLREERRRRLGMMPKAPETYVAHPYTLLTTPSLVGRKKELTQLREWLEGSEEFRDIRVLVVVALGGMGKSALTWELLNKIGPTEAKLAGRMWWSFYAADASFDTFLTHALAYVKNESISAAAAGSHSDRERALLEELGKRPFLFVLDGIERLMIEYNRMDAANRPDEETDGGQAEEKIGAERRKTVDYRVGDFLRACATRKSSKILISSRLYPGDLEKREGGLCPGCFRYDLRELPNEEALAMWQAMGVKGTADRARTYLRTLGNQPLTIQVLAGLVKESRAANGNFDEWVRQNPDFNPGDLDLKQRKTHVLEFALRDLQPRARGALNAVTSFRTPLSFETAAALLVRKKGEPDTAEKPFASIKELDQQTQDLENRGLMGWDGKQFDLHPVVRAKLWGFLNDAEKRDLLTGVAKYAEAKLPPPLPQVLPEKGMEEILKWAIELFYARVGLHHWADAYRAFSDYIDDNLYYLLGRGRDRKDILDHLQEEGLGEYRQTSSGQPLTDWLTKEPRYRALMLYRTAKGAMFLGDTATAAQWFKTAHLIVSRLPVGTFEPPEKLTLVTKPRSVAERGDLEMTILSEASHAQRLSGHFRDAEWSAREAFRLSGAADDEYASAVNRYRLGLILSARGEVEKAETEFLNSLQYWHDEKIKHLEGFVNACLAQQAIWLGDFNRAGARADEAWRLFMGDKREINTIHGRRLCAMAAMGRSRPTPGKAELQRVNDDLHLALSSARQGERVEEVIQSHIAIADLFRRQSDWDDARQRLNELFHMNHERSYPWFHADALNILAMIERGQQRPREAAAAAKRAYELAWCDGPPFAYAWGLETAKKNLVSLDADIPVLAAFDESKFPPMPGAVDGKGKPTASGH